MSLLKFVMLGPAGAGKTTLTQRFSRGSEYIEDLVYKPTIGADFETKQVHFESKPYIVQIWDTAGMERFATTFLTTYRGADCCLLVFDVTDENSFHSLESWRQKFLNAQDANSNVPFIVLGNKMDIAENSPYQMWKQDVIDWCFENSYEYFEVSAKMNSNVTTAFIKAISLATSRPRERSTTGSIKIGNLEGPEETTSCCES